MIMLIAFSLGATIGGFMIGWGVWNTAYYAGAFIECRGERP